MFSVLLPFLFVFYLYFSVNSVRGQSFDVWKNVFIFMRFTKFVKKKERTDLETSDTGLRINAGPA